jgi:hypothetical protein
VLTGGSRDAPERQQTLRATLEWSYTLLEARLQEVLKQRSSIGDTHTLAETLGAAAVVVLARGDASGSAQLCGFATTLRDAHGFELGPYERRLMDETVQTAREAFGPILQPRFGRDRYGAVKSVSCIPSGARTRAFRSPHGVVTGGATW